MREPVTAYVALGANLGDPVQAVQGALARLGELPLTQLAGHSSLYRTAPMDAGGPDYVNAVAQITTELCAPDLLAALQGLEADAGRERPFPNAPRTLDLDLLLFGGGRIESATLTVPHPRMLERAFVLLPLAEIAPQLVAPEHLKLTASQPVQRIPAS